MNEPAQTEDTEEPAAAAERGRSWLLLVGPAVLVVWAPITVLQLLTGLQPVLSWILTAIEVVVAPWLVVAVIVLARQELPREDKSERERSWRDRILRSVGFHAVSLLLLMGSIAAQLQVLYTSYQGAASAELSGSYRSYAVAAFVLVVVALLGSPRRLSRVVAAVADRPARLMVGSFGLVALIGTLLLALPLSLQRVQDASLLGSLFTAVSAVCVTGLSVYNVAETYSAFGQAVILLLMQAGGLGIMVLSSFFAIIAGRRLRARRAVAIAELVDVDSLAVLRRSLVGIVVFTLAVEACGAVLLYFALGAHPEVGLDAAASSAPLAGAGSRLWAAVFHSVSAFCNAGFSIFRGGFQPFAHSWAVPTIAMALIIIGGLGFPVATELMGRLRMLWRRQRRPRLSLHSRVVLLTTAALIGAGAVAFLLLEHDSSMRELSWGHKLIAALFQSVSCRTAGFNTIDFGLMQPATLMIACCLMFIGASPGSTGGGAKTTTLAVLFSSLRAELRNRPQAELAGRALKPSTVRRALAVTIMSVFVVGAVVFVLLLTHHQSQTSTQLVFEAVSAVSTTGLSTGITAQLGVAGKLLLSFAMLIGRIGPLTLALAIAERWRSTHYRLVEEHIGIG